MKTKSAITIVTALLLMIMSTNAQPGKRSLRDENRRIRTGVVSGQLTRGETLRLKRQERKLKKEAIRFKRNDGKISRAERRKLRRDQKRLDRSIRRQKQDRQTRG